MVSEAFKKPPDQIRRVVDQFDYTSPEDKYPNFPYFSFGTLRDLLPDMLRNRFSDDVASLALQHGSLGEDQLLKCYANLPFKRLFEATIKLRPYFRPMLDWRLSFPARTDVKPRTSMR